MLSPVPEDHVVYGSGASARVVSQVPAHLRDKAFSFSSQYYVQCSSVSSSSIDCMIICLYSISMQCKSTLQEGICMAVRFSVWQLCTSQ